MNHFQYNRFSFINNIAERILFKGKEQKDKKKNKKISLFVKDVVIYIIKYNTIKFLNIRWTI